jgi:hypothetical protein
MFADLGYPITDLTKTTAPLPDRATRHCHTPYTYNTRWITHPPEGLVLAPEKDEMWQTSFLATPTVATDCRRNAKHEASKLDALRYNAQKFSELVDAQDAVCVRVHETNMKDIRAQRAAHLKALDARQIIEKRRLHWLD